MNQSNNQKEKSIDKFKRLYQKTQGGIFHNRTRKKIITKEGISGRGRTKDQFWYRQRENVKTGLIDFRLFIEEAGKNNVNQVVNEESLRPIVTALLERPLIHQDPIDIERAEVANLFIKYGLKYLRGGAVTKIHKRSIDEALDLAHYLLLKVRMESEGVKK